MSKINIFQVCKNKYLVASVALLGLFEQVLIPQPVLALLGGADPSQPLLVKEADFDKPNTLPISQNTALVALATPESPQIVVSSQKTVAKPQVGGQRWTIVTAYSSTVDQCDASPHITAKGTLVRDGIVACNFLPFGSQVMFPELYPGKVFIVEDRMVAYNSHKVDIWFPTRWEAKQFGVKYTPVIIMK